MKIFQGGMRRVLGIGTMLGVVWFVGSIGGCVTSAESAGLAPGRSADGVARRPALITHVVLVALADPSERSALLNDCDGLAKIRGLEFFTAGPPLELGRANVDTSFDVGLCMGFASTAAYEGYLSDPLHQKLLKDWASKAKQIRVFDLVDGSP